jgi:hypothetical protein
VAGIETVDPFAGYGSSIALGFSLDAMSTAADRVNKVPATDTAAAFAAIGEAVWWITIVNDTLRRLHRPSYDLAGSLQTPPIDETIAGLISVRHRIGHEVDLVDFIEPVASRPDIGDGRITAWAWRSIRPPTRGDKRDVQGHRAYESALAGRNVVHAFQDAVAFLRSAQSNAQHGIPAAD